MAVSLILFWAASLRKDRSSSWSNKIAYKVSTFLLFLGIFLTATDQKFGAIGIAIVAISLLLTCLIYSRQKVTQKKDEKIFLDHQLSKKNNSSYGIVTNLIDYSLLFLRVIMILIAANLLRLSVTLFADKF